MRWHAKLRNQRIAREIGGNVVRRCDVVVVHQIKIIWHAEIVSQIQRLGCA
jgi:hypothetical protein